jgi:hypothetical protein
MSDPDLLPPYSDSLTVYRAIGFPDWIKKDGSVRKQAFNRRPNPADSRGLSCSPDRERCRDGLKTFGVIEFEVGAVRQIDTALDVIPDSPTHANITGVPYRDDDRGRHDFLATKLAEISRGKLDPA